MTFDYNMSISQPLWTFNSMATNTTVTTVVVTATKKRPLIDKETKIILEYIIQIGMFYTIGVFGIIVNIINIIVYKKQGLKDSITLGLFALSISDLFVSGLPAETATFYVLKLIFPDPYNQFISVHYIFAAWCRRMFYSLSCMLTAMLSLERCFCIILPFHVKVIFTRTRTAIIIMFLATFHVLCYAPIFATHQLRWKTSPLENGTRYLGLWFAPHRGIIEDFNSTTMSVITPTLAQVIVTCCAVVMIHGLRQASKFRKAMTSGIAKANDNSQNNENENSKSKQTSTLSPRDIRLVRTMVFIVALLSACNVPYLITVNAMLIVPDLNIHKTYHNIFSLLQGLNAALSGLNSSFNIFIYYNTSSKYKEIFQQVFSWCHSKEKR